MAGNLDQLPEYQNVPVRVDRLRRFIALLSSTNVRGSMGRVDDEKGQKWTMKAHGDYVNGQLFTQGAGHLRHRPRAAAGALVPVAAQRGRLLAAAARPNRLRTSSSAASATTTWTIGEEKRYREVDELSRRRDQRNRRPQFRAVDCSNGRCRPGGSAASARPAAYLSWLQPGAVRERARDEPRRRVGAPARRSRRAGRSTCGSPCCRRSR